MNSKSVKRKKYPTTCRECCQVENDSTTTILFLLSSETEIVFLEAEDLIPVLVGSLSIPWHPCEGSKVVCG